MARVVAVASFVHVGIRLLFIMLELGQASEMYTGSLGATASGDVIIGGLFPIHLTVEKNNNSFAPHLQKCIGLEHRRLVKALVMINAIETVNKSPLLADANITLGYWIMDSCSDVSTALRATAKFTGQTDCHTNNSSNNSNNTSAQTPPVMAVIGAAHSEMSIAVARQLTLEMIPQISYSSTAVILSDKSRFPAFLRTIPNDVHQTAAMVRLLKNHGWNWVGFVFTDGDYGKSALDNFVSQASEQGICVAFKSTLPGSLSGPDIDSAIRLAARTIYNNPKVKVIVSFSKSTHMKLLFQELSRQTLEAGDNITAMKRVWIASDSWSFSNFELYMQLNKSKSPWTEVVTSLRAHTDADIVFSIEMAVSAVAQAVASLCRSKDCKTPGSVQPWKLLEELRTQEFEKEGKKYKFDKRGDINLGYNMTMWRSHEGNIHVHDVVAEYHPHNNSFSYTKHSSTMQLKELQHIISKCSNSCIPGQFKKTAEGQHTCCYECINCTENYYSNNTDMDQCLSCDSNTQWAPEGSSSCKNKDLLYFSWRDGFAVVLVSFAGLGILLTLLLSALFLYQRNTPVVKAAGGPLSQVILFSLAVSFVSTMLFVGRPNSLQCKCRQVLFGISFTLCVSCILVKTLQILLAFQFNPELQEALKKLYQPYAIIFVCVALQVTTCICWLVLKSPYNRTISNPTTLLENCHEGSYLAFGVMLGYIAVLAFVCFICAYKGRKLPNQYNEAKFITFSMLLYLISWMLFVPIYVTTSGVYLPAVEMVVILISNYGILSCHFFPKCYVMLLKKEKNTKSAFRETLYEYSCRSISSFTMSQSSGSELPSGSPQTSTVNSSVSSFPVIPADPPQTTVVTDSTDVSYCTVLYQGSIMRRKCLRRSTSI
uniref:G-protein coupled receptor family C group 6 member A n=1 Tax=Sphaeramia orbicularis TaxID=375764 RepID=A0A673B609_9TELE